MPIIKIKSAVLSGYSTQSVTIEALKTRGLSQLLLTGLPDIYLKDSRDKIRALVGQLAPWSHLDRVIAHIIPPETEKIGAHLELPLALACLMSINDKEISEEILNQLENTIFLGALSLNGTLEITRSADILSEDLQGTCVGPYQSESLSEIYFAILNGELSNLKKKNLKNTKSLSLTAPLPEPKIFTTEKVKIKGLAWERMWILAAAVRQIPVLLMGPPGIGKSTLAKWATQVLPKTDCLSVATDQRKIWRLANSPLSESAVPRLFPHPKSHISEFMGTKSRSRQYQPGYFSMAHGGVLVLDEFLEMNRDCREILRTILERKKILNRSANDTTEWPADFWLIATMNPCPCGYLEGNYFDRCRCTHNQLRQYQNRLSGPLWDRFGLKLFVKSHSEPLPGRAVPPEIEKIVTQNSSFEGLQEIVKKARMDWNLSSNETSYFLESISESRGFSSRELGFSFEIIHSLRVIFNLPITDIFQMWETKKAHEQESMPQYFPNKLSLNSLPRNL